MNIGQTHSTSKWIMNLHLLGKLVLSLKGPLKLTSSYMPPISITRVGQLWQQLWAPVGAKLISAAAASRRCQQHSGSSKLPLPPCTLGTLDASDSNMSPLGELMALSISQALLARSCWQTQTSMDSHHYMPTAGRTFSGGEFIFQSTLFQVDGKYRKSGLNSAKGIVPTPKSEKFGFSIF